jgi:hypothetical protein
VDDEIALGGEDALAMRYQRHLNELTTHMQRDTVAALQQTEECSICEELR